jgi:hypothetical protein
MHNNGVFCNVGYSKRAPVGLINDPLAQQTMRTWMYHATMGPMPATSAEFALFVHAHWGIKIMNARPGGKNYRVFRNGTYTNADGTVVSQSMYFAPGDVLLDNVSVSAGAHLSTSAKVWKAVATHLPGTVIVEESELVGVAKGMRQILLERGRQFTCGACARAKHRATTNANRKACMEEWKNDKVNYAKLTALLQYPTSEELVEQVSAVPCTCVDCVLSDEDDFKNQPSGLQEIYDKHNQQYGTKHKCIFLPKFHPELNPIERCWSRMKHHVRQVNNGTIVTLREAMAQGLSSENLPLSTIRKYCRFVHCYYEAYELGLDIVRAEKWLRQRRSHRGYAPNMDSRLEAIYFPTGRSIDEPFEQGNNISFTISEAEESEVLEESVDALFPDLQ